MEAGLSRQISRLLTPELTDYLRRAAEFAARQDNARLYLVGGAVRDLLLEQPTRDLDLMVDGDAVRLAETLNETSPGKLWRHRRFGTAKIIYADFAVDFASLRDETYARPGALPDVKPGSIATDLKRRDFTVNAMAASLMPDDFGGLIDLYGGLDDLTRGQIRVLHDGSFRDDACRIWRALRYEQRLGFKLARETEALLRRDLPMLATITPERLRYEIECVFSEDEPENTLSRAADLGVLACLHTKLKFKTAAAARFRAARVLTAPKMPSFDLYLGLLAYDLPETTRLGRELRLTKRNARVLADLASAKTDLATLADAGTPPSRVYRLLHGLDITALQAAAIALPIAAASEVNRYLEIYRYVKPTLNGHDLLELGVPPGPEIVRLTERLRAALLDGKISTRREEITRTKRWM